MVNRGSPCYLGQKTPQGLLVGGEGSLVVLWGSVCVCMGSLRVTIFFPWSLRVDLGTAEKTAEPKAAGLD